jgi:hypothetical protein
LSKSPFDGEIHPLAAQSNGWRELTFQSWCDGGEEHWEQEKQEKESHMYDNEKEMQSQL